MNAIFFHILFLGIALFQCLFMIVQWFAFRRVDYLYYIVYIISCSVYIFFRVNSVEPIAPFEISVKGDAFLDQPVILFAFWMYIRFGYFFLNLKKLQPAVYKAGKRLEYAFIVAFVADVILNAIGISTSAMSYIFAGMALALALVSIPLLIRLMRQKNILNNFLVTGALAISIGGLCGTLMVVLLPAAGNNLSFLLSLEIGVIIELLLLNTGFMFKNKILQQQVSKTREQLFKQLEHDSRSMKIE